MVEALLANSLTLIIYPPIEPKGRVKNLPYQMGTLDSPHKTTQYSSSFPAETRKPSAIDGKTVAHW